MKTCLILLSNDVVTDQRVLKVATVLSSIGFSVEIIGRELPKSLPINLNFPFKIKRLKLFFNSGALFYAELNIRLFFRTLFSSQKIIHSNDLDTLPAAFYASKLRGKKLVFDSHEYFTGVPELKNNPTAYKVWKFFEKKIVPQLQYCITVNDSIANLFWKEYQAKFKVIRNIPPLIAEEKLSFTKKDLNLPEDKYILILQGSGINIGRGAEELILSLKYIQSDVLLVLIGGGDVWEDLKQLTLSENLGSKVRFIEKVPYLTMMNYTLYADLGFSLDKDNSINYKLSLPNKIFDYVMMQTPVVVSPLPEPVKIVEKYQVGYVLDAVEPNHIAKLVDKVLKNQEDLAAKKQNCKRASKELNWENESSVLIEIYEQISR